MTDYDIHLDPKAIEQIRADRDAQWLAWIEEERCSAKAECEISTVEALDRLRARVEKGEK